MREKLTRLCERCGTPFHPQPYRVSRGQGRFCSRACVREIPRPLLDLAGGTVVGIPLTGGKLALIDPDDAGLVAPVLWQARWTYNTFYAVGTVPVAGVRASIYLHRFLLGSGIGRAHVDHISGDTLDNRRVNLRVATPSQNHANQRRRADNSSGFKGVSFDKARGLWTVQIGVRGHYVYVGRFADPVEAARAYDAKARELFGEFARPNFPDEAAA